MAAPLGRSHLTHRGHLGTATARRPRGAAARRICQETHRRSQKRGVLECVLAGRPQHGQICRQELGH
eukprot:4494633-Lingulodinium_polyedra.AAC.1